jgi:hypothetical protein
MLKPNKSKIILLTYQQIEALKQQLLKSRFGQSHQKNFISALSFNFWLKTQLDSYRIKCSKIKKSLRRGVPFHR